MPPSEIANLSPSAIVMPEPSVIPSIFKTASTAPNSNASAPALTLSTWPALPMLNDAPNPP